MRGVVTPVVLLRLWFKTTIKKKKKKKKIKKEKNPTSKSALIHIHIPPLSQRFIFFLIFIFLLALILDDTLVLYGCFREVL